MLLREFCENEKFMYFFRIFSCYHMLCLETNWKKNFLKKGKKEEKIIIKKWEDRYGYKGRRRPYSKK